MLAAEANSCMAAGCRRLCVGSTNHRSAQLLCREQVWHACSNHAVSCRPPACWPLLGAWITPIPRDFEPDAAKHIRMLRSPGHMECDCAHNCTCIANATDIPAHTVEPLAGQCCLAPPARLTSHACALHHQPPCAAPFDAPRLIHEAAVHFSSWASAEGLQRWSPASVSVPGQAHSWANAQTPS